MELSKEDILEEFPHAKPELVDVIVGSLEVLEEYGIDTPLRLAHFLAQTSHESGGFRAVEENLNYKAETLSKIFPKYFKDKDPNDYAKQPEKIANLVYGSRMGNGPAESGDGYRYRGRGLIQLTGKSNYEKFAAGVESTLEEAVEYLTTPEGAVESAAWFWANNGLNELADTDDVVKVTKRINGGTIGLAERQAHTEAFKEMLGV
ncbi:COG3179 Predicted chitinase [uncultured Caudovirales phage]|uniref:COG3179 Predicted chitinase n=1 Tax=uncultured Caudovirales phage TaxID=2100421 RepID=A0A6J7X1M2_9CAUD|nr:COG3179 Predicted chitinase [uncultured Caudovirales phage]